MVTHRGACCRQKGKAVTTGPQRYDQVYTTALKQGNPERSHLEGNITFLERTGLLHPALRTLEIGCGAGSLAGLLARQDCKVVATEISRVALTYAAEEHPNVSFMQMDGTRLAFSDMTFDLVVSFDAFEHISPVGRHLEEVHRVLKPAGAYLFGTPNKYPSIAFSLLRDRNRNYRIYHPSLQSAGSLRTLLRKHGFDASFCPLAMTEEFVYNKVRPVLGKQLAALCARIEWDKLPASIRPSFYVIAMVEK